LFADPFSTTADSIFTAFWPNFYNFPPQFLPLLTHFLPLSDPFSTSSGRLFLAPETSLLLPRGPAREFIFFRFAHNGNEGALRANKRLRRGQQRKINFPALFNILI
jgi:hypothetical protein